MTKRGATGDFIFIFVPLTFFSPKIDNIFLQNQKMWKKKKIAAARLATIVATRCTGNWRFF